MAGVYRYYCRKCKFEVESEGAESRGFLYKCKCMKCNSCGSIGDRVTATGSDNEPWLPVPIVCSCGSTDLSEWNFMCPKCDIKMSRQRKPIAMAD